MTTRSILAPMALATMALAALLSACAPAATTGAADAPRPRQDRITAAEIDTGVFETAYDAVRALRPAWLHGRGTLSVSNPAGSRAIVYLNGSRLGNLEALQTLRAADVAGMQFLTSREATIRFGTGHPGGVILVTSRRG